ncbi:OLC1v1029757C1 [Oldenlandia corymbosa var. corymbosa]|uniref:OLC1v1029757C1 n=1 Tax=Oldenlandia corymbosa var. corymbosa TaxID=529605 RepID=A0AAV1CES1_OLDCO|nr:OLC1v1029757C1 [Oldenlandia corymbosa var. corymbosa]
MLIPDELIWEVLRWLPVKSLMQFKCVSKTWLSVIKDLSFAKAYCGGYRGLLSGQPARFQPCNNRCLFYIGLDGGTATTHQILPYYILEHENRDQMILYTDVVNGLLCFYQGKHSWLCNVATREMMQLPSSTDSSEENNFLYHFGFDPINKHYKLLKTSLGSIEILTVGVDSYWRKVYSLPPVDISSQSACIGGVLCWIEKYEPVLVAFHLAEEKFIPIPSPVEPAEIDFYFNEGMDIPYVRLMKFGSSIIVTKEIDAEEDSGEILRYCRPDCDGHGSVESGGSWVDVLTQLRQMDIAGSSLNTLQIPTAVGVLPNGKMLIYDQKITFPADLYILDPVRRKQELIKVNASKELLDEYDCVCPIEIFGNCSYLEENILPLNYFISSGEIVS